MSFASEHEGGGECFWVLGGNLLDFGSSEALPAGRECLAATFLHLEEEEEEVGSSWRCEELLYVAPVLEEDPVWEAKDMGPPHCSPKGLPYIGKPSIFRGDWKGL